MLKLIPLISIATISWLLHSAISVNDDGFYDTSYSVVSDSLCPNVSQDANRVINVFALDSNMIDFVSLYDIDMPDTSEISVVLDSVVCESLDLEITRILEDSILSFDTDLYSRSFFESDSYYYAVNIPFRHDSLYAAPDDSISGHVTIGITGIIVFDKEYNYKQGFPY